MKKYPACFYAILSAALLLTACSKQGSPTKNIVPVTQAVVTTLAGNGTYGTSNGLGSAASFSYPDVLCIDASGNLYVGDGGDFLVRKITPDGLATTFGVIDTGKYQQLDDGTWGMARDNAGNIYFSVTLGAAVFKFAGSSQPTLLAGAGTLGNVDGQGTAARFSNLPGMVCDASGNIYVADYDNKSIRKVTPNGVVTTVPGTGIITTGTSTSAVFLSLQSIALDKNGVFYVTDPILSAVTRFDPVSRTAKNLCTMSYPAGIAVDNNENVYVSDMKDHIINKIAADGTITRIAGTGKRGYKDGNGSEAQFALPQSLALDPTGKILYVADAGNSVIRKIILPQ